MASSDLNENTQKCIASLLTSCPTQCTIRVLSNDYKNLIGTEIPYENLGFRNLEHYLLSIPHVVKISGRGPQALLEPVISQKSAHINELVTKQKTVPRKRGFNPPRRRSCGLPPPPKPTTPIYYPEVKPLMQQKIQYPKFSLQRYSLPPRLTKKPEEQPKIPLVIPEEKPEKIVPVKAYNVPVPQEKKYPSMVSLLKNLTLCDLKHGKNENGNAASSSSGIETDSSGKNVNKNALLNGCKAQFMDRNIGDRSMIPPRIQENLKLLMEECHDGLWGVDLPDNYKSKFNERLNFRTFGYRTLLDMCIALPNIFKLHDHTSDDFKVYSVLHKLEESPKTTSVLKQNDPKFWEQPCPNLSWNHWIRFVPEDVVPLGTEIRHQFVSDELNIQDVIDIVVAEIYDPSKFWINLRNTGLDTLMDNMQTFYKEHHAKYLIPENLIKEGLYCVQVIFNEYHRAVIVNTLPDVEGQVRVVYIDYGTMTKASTEGLCFLVKDFSDLPAQAIRSRLSNIYPRVKGSPWPRETTQRFQSFINSKDICAKICAINRNDQYLELYIADRGGSKITYINDILVEEKLAQYVHKAQEVTFQDPKFKAIVQNIHLFPTFYELEVGLAPSTGEMAILHDMGVPMYFCYPQYFQAVYDELDKKEEALIQSLNETNPVPPCSILHDYDIEQIKDSYEFDYGMFGELEGEIRKLMGTELEEKALGEEFEFEDVDTETSGDGTPPSITPPITNPFRNPAMLSQLETSQISEATNPFLGEDLNKDRTDQDKVVEKTIFIKDEDYCSDSSSNNNVEVATANTNKLNANAAEFVQETALVKSLGPPPGFKSLSLKKSQNQWSNASEVAPNFNFVEPRFMPVVPVPTQWSSGYPIPYLAQNFATPSFIPPQFFEGPTYHPSWTPPTSNPFQQFYNMLQNFQK